MSKITYNLTTGSQVTADIMAEIKESVNQLYNVKGVYRALLEQTGTEVPTATVLENTTGFTFAYTRDGVGSYIATPNNALPTDKVFVTVGQNSTPIGLTFISCNYYNNGSISISTHDMGASNANVDDKLYYTPIEILIYE